MGISYTIYFKWWWWSEFISDFSMFLFVVKLLAPIFVLKKKSSCKLFYWLFVCLLACFRPIFFLLFLFIIIIIISSQNIHSQTCAIWKKTCYNQVIKWQIQTQMVCVQVNGDDDDLGLSWLVNFIWCYFAEKNSNQFNERGYYVEQ